MNITDIKKEISTCPDSPNCISSLTSSKDHYLEPWKFKKDKDYMMKVIKEAVLKLPRVELKDSADDHYHFIFTSLILRFKDDVWLHWDDQNKTLHFKSASRIGRSDFGANKKRLLEIKSQIQALIQP